MGEKPHFQLYRWPGRFALQGAFSGPEVLMLL
jgi:hypothetical protein